MLNMGLRLAVVVFYDIQEQMLSGILVKKFRFDRLLCLGMIRRTVVSELWFTELVCKLVTVS